MDIIAMLSIWISIATTLLSATIVTGRDNTGYQSGAPPRRNKLRNGNGNREPVKPNIVFIITDDQDTELGSMNFMPKTLRLLQDEGAHFHNAFVTTPMCCPSRSSMLTGLYVHNHHTYTNNVNCSSLYWRDNFEVRNFGTYLSNAGYRTGYFGKYLNDYQGTYIPPGWTEWVGLVRNTRFYNYSVNFNGEVIRHGDDYRKDYLTDLIANDSVTFLKQSKQYFPNRPVAMVLSMPAPHGPEDAAPQHQHMFFNVTTHKTPSWNYAPNADKQWLLQHTGKMEPIHIAFTDLLQTKRLQTLQAVDDAVEKVYNELKALGELENTYIVYSSDHGYHLGQYGLIKGKALPYDFDIRVPFYMRGPKVPRGVRVPNIALNIDLAPTFLDMAGVEIPEHMDGRSLLPLFEDNVEFEGGNKLKRKKAWRDTFLVERGKVTNKKIKERARIEANNNPQHQLQSKDERLERKCQKAEFQPPCSPRQEWVCGYKEDGTLRMYKCRGKGKYKLSAPADTDDVMKMQRDEACVCPKRGSKISRSEKRRQQQFLAEHVNQPEHFKPKFLKTRLQRDLEERERRRDRRHRSAPDFKNTGRGPAVCKILDNSKVVCSRNVYEDRRRWRKQRKQVHSTIEDLKAKLDNLREIKNHLKGSRPEDEGLGISGSDSEYNSRLPGDGDSIGRGVDNGGYNVQTDDPYYDTLFSSRPNPNLDQSNLPRQNDQPRRNNLRDEQEFYNSNNENKRQNRRKNKGNKNSRIFNEELFEEVEPTDDWSIPIETLPIGTSRAPEQPIHDSEMDYDDGNFDYGYEYDFDPEDYADEESEYESSLDNDDDVTGCVCDDEPMMDERDRVKQEREERRQKRKQEIQEKKNQKKEEREQQRQEKRKNKDDDDEELSSSELEINPTRDCHSPSMKCFEHNNDHWRTAPLWTKGPFCFCPNSNNNTYWCVRTLNDTHNFLYCEFITGFINYYDMNKDPYQLRNAVRDLSYATLNLLHNTLVKLKSCKGARECTERTRPDGGASKEKPEPIPDGSGDLETGSGDLFSASDNTRFTILDDARRNEPSKNYEVKEKGKDTNFNDVTKTKNNDVIGAAGNGGNGRRNLDLDLEFGKFPVPGRASVVIEMDTTGSGEEPDMRFDDIAKDPRKEKFLYWTNMYRLDTTFLDKDEVRHVFETNSELRENIPAFENAPNFPQNRNTKDKAIFQDSSHDKNTEVEISLIQNLDKIDFESGMDLSGDEPIKSDVLVDNVLLATEETSKTSSLPEYDSEEIEFIKNVREDPTFAGPPIVFDDSTQHRRRHRHSVKS